MPAILRQKKHPEQDEFVISMLPDIIVLDRTYHKRLQIIAQWKVNLKKRS